MRKATLINQDWLRSKTMALAGDVIENIAFRLLLISDDFGRFPDDPEGLRVMMNDVRHTPEQIKKAIDYLVDARTVERYVVRHEPLCCWVRWDDYQNIKWHDDAKYPDIEGEYEVSNNPRTIARRADKRNVERTVKRHVARHVERTVPQKEKEKEKESESESASRARARELSNDTLNDTSREKKNQDVDDDDENASLEEEMGLVREIFPLFAKDTESIKPQVAAILELKANHDFPTIRRVCKWAVADAEFYRIRFISFPWLLDPGSEDMTHFKHMCRQYEIRGPQIGEDGAERLSVGPYVCSECGNEHRIIMSKGFRPPSKEYCQQEGHYEDGVQIRTAILADDWTEQPLEDE